MPGNPTTGSSLKAAMVSSVMFEVRLSALFVVLPENDVLAFLSFPQSSVEAPFLRRPQTTARSHAEPNPSALTP
jgi:hypothetical protein